LVEHNLAKVGVASSSLVSRSKSPFSIAPGDPRHRGIVVAGYARSGTSTIARSLAVLGVDLGHRLRAGEHSKNPRGFFEDQAVLSINRRLRKVLLSRQGVSLVPADAFLQPRVRRLHEEAVEAIHSGFGASPVWGIKNNGILRFFPFWQDVFRELDVDMAYVVAVRDPQNAVQSRRKHRSSKPLQPPRSLEIDMYEWLVYVVPYFSCLRGLPFVVVDYDRLMAEPGKELERMSSALGLPEPASRPEAAGEFVEGFLSGDLRHFSAGPCGHDEAREMPPLVAEAWRWLQRLSCDEVSADDERLWAAWEQIDAQLQSLAPHLAELDCVEEAARRWAMLNPRSLGAWLRQKVGRWSGPRRG
jgi:hypothetical protein